MLGSETPTSTQVRDRSAAFVSVSDLRRAQDPQSASARLFDLWSEIYDVESVQQLAYRPVPDSVLDALRAQPGRSILDLGYGTELFTRRVRPDPGLHSQFDINPIPAEIENGASFSYCSVSAIERSASRQCRGGAIAASKR